MSVHLPASATLEAVNVSAQIYEETIGALVLMKTDNDMTLLKFDATGGTQADLVEISQQVDGKPKIPEGHKLVTSGQIILEGKAVLCAATRKTA